MITVIVVIIVVIIFCCFVPFWRALKKRDHHWEDPENDPRWDLDNFQFSTTSPRAERKLGDNDYNSLSVSSNNNSSTHTSNSAVNSSFRNNYQLPRWFIEDRIFKILIYFLIIWWNGELRVNISDSLIKLNSKSPRNMMTALWEKLVTAVKRLMIINQQ